MKTVASAPIPEVPGDWEAITLGEVCHVENGCPFESKYFNAHAGLPLVRVRDVNAGASKTFYSGPYEDKYLVDNGDLLVGMDGEFQVRKWTAGTALLNQRVCRLVPNIKRLNRDFLGYVIRAPLKHIEAHTPYTTVKHISARQILAIPLPFPPLDEQRRIAAVLSAVQRALERQEGLIALSAELKRALMHKLFTKGTRGEAVKQTEIGSIPRNWQTVKLADAVECIDYGISAPIPKATPPDGVKIVSTADITKDGEILFGKIRRIVAPARTAQRLTLKHGDVLFNWRNSSELIGKSAVFEEQAEPHVFASFILRIRCDETRSHNVFLSYLMNYYREQGVFIKLSRRAVNQANYNRNEISVLCIPLPSLDEQVEIASTITTVVNARSIHVRRRDALKLLFRTLLHLLMSARIRVRDLDLSALEEAEQEPAGAV